MIQSSVEPAENKSFSSVDVICTIYELEVWHNYKLYCLNRRVSFARRRQTEINFSALHGVTRGIFFSFTASSSLFKSSSSDWED